jgi:glycosyltransferase involved in cell wall biosynthesis
MSDVVLISEHASPLATLGGVDAGGQNVYVACLARALADLGHRVTVLTRRDDDRLPDRVLMGPGIAVEHIDAGPARPIDKDDLFRHMPQFADGALRAIRRRPVDVLHSHFWMSGWVGSRLREASGVPLVHTFHALGTVKRRHQGQNDTSPVERDGIERMLVREADRVIATCTDEQHELVRIGGKPQRIAVIPAGFDGDVFHPGSSPRWFEVDRADRPLRAVAVSRLVPRKGIADILRALALVDRAELTVVGGPDAAQLPRDDHHGELCQLATDLGVRHRVTFTGGVEPARVAAIHRDSDLFVAAPWYEPFGIAPVEAMGCALPVVGTAVGGLLDTVIDGGTGALVPPHAPDVLAATIEDLRRQPELRHELGARAAWRAHRRFTWPTVARSIAEVYRLVGAGTAADGRAHGGEGRRA